MTAEGSDEPGPFAMTAASRWVDGKRIDPAREAEDDESLRDRGLWTVSARL
jgi:hypothetical protein